jgi:RNA polymerase sigma-70 factor (ECF subfamily)
MNASSLSFINPSSLYGVAEVEAVHDAEPEFEQRRGMLLGLAYRILGSRADAEDAVQDTYIKWRLAARHVIDNPGSWLASTCTRRCIDLLRAAHKSRIGYVGTWLPEPLQTRDDSAEDKMTLALSLTTAFLLVLERLTPKERAAYLLREIFEIPYPDVARSLDLPETACRKLVSRARANVDKSNVRHVAPCGRQKELVAAFTSAVVEGNTAELTDLLSNDIQLCADGGGKVPTLLETLRGKPSVLEFVGQSLRQYWADCERTVVGLNGGLGIVLRAERSVVAAVSFAYDERGLTTRIFIVRNPDKLVRLDAKLEVPAVT